MRATGRCDLATSVAERSSLTALLPTVMADAQTSESKIRAIVRWVRSHISPTSVEGEARGVDTVLKSGSGDAEERAIVLATMMTVAGIPASVVWANDRSFADLPKFFPDPYLGERMLVRVDANRGRLYRSGVRHLPSGGRPLAQLRPRLRRDRAAGHLVLARSQRKGSHVLLGTARPARRHPRARCGAQRRAASPDDPPRRER